MKGSARVFKVGEIGAGGASFHKIRIVFTCFTADGLPDEVVI